MTIGCQGFNIYEINKLLVDLSNPLLTEEAKENVENLKHGYFNLEDYVGTKSVYEKMKRDGIMRFYRSNAVQLQYIFDLMNLIVESKNMIVKKLQESFTNL